MFSRASAHLRNTPTFCWRRMNGERGLPSTRTRSPSLYEACKPEILGQPVVRSVAVFQYLRGVLESIVEQKDIDAVALRVGELLDEILVVENAEASPHLRTEKPLFGLHSQARRGT